jgi:ribonucleoside-diphosphate reductase alpha chain
MPIIGPRNPASAELHAAKYRQRGENFDDYCVRYARTTADDAPHFRRLLEGLRSQAILPGGRQQRAVGWPFLTTAFNCFVGGTIPDDTEGIGNSLTQGMLTLRSGGGCGWDFSPLRPSGEPIRKLGDDAYASGPVSFMGMWHAMCSTIRSAGERRGAMMGVLNVHHPDIMTFVRAKADRTSLTNFNISVGATNEFMAAVEADGLYDLRFPVRQVPGGPPPRVFRTVRALDVWAAIMEQNWDWSEPGVLFLDTINWMNPLHYCEWLDATNPCGEQPLPPDGACLLLSLNLVKYIVPTYWRRPRPEAPRGTGAVHGGDMITDIEDPRLLETVRRLQSADPAGWGDGDPRRTDTGRGGDHRSSSYELDLDRFAEDVNASVRACDNVFEKTVYPLPAQQAEALAKRRMGVGVTGMANALEVCGHPYGSAGYLEMQDAVLTLLRDTAYRTSVGMARSKGSFPLFDAEKWLASGFGCTLPDDIRDGIARYGLRNGLLLSLAPTGTISLTADNVSASIEPPPALEVDRVVNYADGPRTVPFNDYALEEYGVRCRTALQVPVADHVEVLCRAQKLVDSAISKTINLAGAKTDPRPPLATKGSPAGDRETSFKDFKDIYLQVWRGGGKGCTTYNINGKRGAVIKERAAVQDPGEYGKDGRPKAESNGLTADRVGTPDDSCYTDPATGNRTCG